MRRWKLWEVFGADLHGFRPVAARLAFPLCLRLFKILANRVHYMPTSPKRPLSSPFPYLLALTLYFCLVFKKKYSMKIPSDKLYRWVFHIILWTIWIGLPIINAGDNEKHRTFMITIIPVTLTNIPLFLLNSEWLIPQVFRKKGIGTYLISLLLLIAAFSTLQLFMKEWILPDDLIRFHYDIFWAVIPVVFVTAISTGYGFITYLLEQERHRREERQERLQSELSFLRSQISPHFIFNILNSIVYLIRSKSAQAEPVTIKLSELMRYMLYESADEQVPLAKEIDYLENYVELQKIRFEEDVDILLAITGEPGSQVIEPMLLIPFVENAFKHGVGMIRQPMIDISLKINAVQLLFTVKNKMAEGSLEEKDNSSGIGLRNVRRRLELLYPGSHHLHIKKEGEWFEVVLDLKLAAPIAAKEKNYHETALHSH